MIGWMSRTWCVILMLDCQPVPMWRFFLDTIGISRDCDSPFERETTIGAGFLMLEVTFWHRQL